MNRRRDRYRGWVGYFTGRRGPSVLAPATVAALAVTQLSVQSGSSAQPLVPAIVLSALLTLPLIWRWRAPRLVFVLVVVVAFVQWLADIRLVADAALLVALYTVAVRCRPREVVAAALVVEIGVVAAVVRWDATGDRLDSGVLLTGLLAAAVSAGLAVRNHLRAIEAAVESGRHLAAEREQAAIIELAAERQRIARELHDVVAHGLSLMVTMADAAAAKREVDPQQSLSAMRQVSQTGREALADMRRLLGVLRADDQSERRPQPSIRDLEELLDSTRRSGLSVATVIRGEPSSADAGVQLIVYRVVQEALTNVVRHANPRASVTLSMDCDDERILVQVSDDGHGASPSTSSESPTPVSGYGIAGMAERVAGFGGWVDAGPRPAGGWFVMAMIPLHAGLEGEKEAS